MNIEELNQLKEDLDTLYSKLRSISKHVHFRDKEKYSDAIKIIEYVRDRHECAFVFEEPELLDKEDGYKTKLKKYPQIEFYIRMNGKTCVWLKHRDTRAVRYQRFCEDFKYLITGSKRSQFFGGDTMEITPEQYKKNKEGIKALYDKYEKEKHVYELKRQLKELKKQEENIKRQLNKNVL
jgi:hypothetical protein